MITLPKYLDRSNEPVVRLVGIGNAGVNLADRITMEAKDSLQVVAMNSDQQSLSSSIAHVKVALGSQATRGLGAGGDPEMGLEAARESMSEIQEALTGSDIVFLCAGLGGGTASGAGGMVAEMVKQSGALLIAVVTSPFAFEGRRRSAQATASLHEIAKHADAVIHFENDRMVELSAPRSGVAETFSTCDSLLAGCVIALRRLIATPGPLSVGLPDLLSVLSAGQGLCLFGTGEAVGNNRAYESLEAALKSPLLDRGRLLDDAASLLIHISGPSNLSFAEVGAAVQEIARQASDSTILHLGVSSVGDASSVVVTLLGKCGTPSAHVEVPHDVRVQKPQSRVEPELSPAAEEKLSEPEIEKITESIPVKPPVVQQPQKTSSPAKTSIPKIKQETLQFEPVARGRFEKIEPTIVEGEDLDVPTFLRQNIKKR